MKIRVVEERNPITLISNKVLKRIKAIGTQEFLWWTVKSVVLLQVLRLC